MHLQLLSEEQTLHLQLLSKKQTLLSKLEMMSNQIPMEDPQHSKLTNLQMQLEKSLQRQRSWMQKNPATRIAMEAQANKIIETTDALVSTKGELSKDGLAELATAVGESVESPEEVYTERPITQDSDENTGQQNVKSLGISKSKWHPETFKHAFILVFTNYKRVYSIKNQNFINAEDVLSNLTFEKDEKHIYCCGTTNFKGFMLFGFENGKVTKVHSNAYQTRNKYLESAFYSHSNLCFITYIEKDIEILAHNIETDNRIKAFIFNTNLIIPTSWRNNIGIQVMRISERGGKLDGLKTLDKVNIKDKNYYLRKDIPQIGVFVRTNEGESI